MGEKTEYTVLFLFRGDILLANRRGDLNRRGDILANLLGDFDLDALRDLLGDLDLDALRDLDLCFRDLLPDTRLGDLRLGDETRYMFCL